MSAALAETVSSGVGQKLLDRFLSPSFYFWTGGGIAYLRARNDLSLSYFQAWTEIELFVAAFVAISLIAGSSLLVEYLHFPMLRILEGYWNPRFSRLRMILVSRQLAQFETLQAQREDLAKRFDALSAEQLTEYAATDKRLVLYPENRAHVMPSRFGNIMRAAEMYSSSRYGLAAVLFWPRLWLVIPQETRDELTEARRKIDRRIGMMIWSALFALWSVFTPWALLIAAVAALACYPAVVSAAVPHGELYRSAFDIYHRKIFAEMEWSLEDEPAPISTGKGLDLTMFIWRGSRPSSKTSP